MKEGNSPPVRRNQMTGSMVNMHIRVGMLLVLAIFYIDLFLERETVTFERKRKGEFGI